MILSICVATLLVNFVLLLGLLMPLVKEVGAGNIWDIVILFAGPLSVFIISILVSKKAAAFVRMKLIVGASLGFVVSSVVLVPLALIGAALGSVGHM